MNVTIKVAEKCFMIYDDSMTFIDLVPRDTPEQVSEIVAKIVEDRILNGNKSSSLW